MSARYELYGGPLDGLDITLPRSLGEDGQVELDLSTRMFTPEVKGMVSKPSGTALYQMDNGTHRFVRQNGLANKH